MTEQEIEHILIEKLCDLKYIYRQDIRDRASLEQNFREKFESLNRVNLTDAEFSRLLDSIIMTEQDKKQLGATLKASGHEASDHFRDVTKMIGPTARDEVRG